MIGNGLPTARDQELRRQAIAIERRRRLAGQPREGKSSASRPQRVPEQSSAPLTEAELRRLAFAHERERRAGISLRGEGVLPAAPRQVAQQEGKRKAPWWSWLITDVWSFVAFGLVIALARILGGGSSPWLKRSLIVLCMLLALAVLLLLLAAALVNSWVPGIVLMR